MIKKVNRQFGKVYVFNYDDEAGLFTFNRPLAVDEAREVASEFDRAVRENYRNAKGLTGCLGVAKDGALYNMNSLKGIMANRILMGETGEKWFPTIGEGLLLYDARLLPTEYLIDFGLVVYNAQSPNNEEIAESLVETANRNGYALPLLASFKSLNLKLGGERYGVIPQIVSDDGLITGEEAEELLEKRFTLIETSGFQRLDIGAGGVWLAGWSAFDSFNRFCRIGRISTFGSEETLGNLIGVKNIKEVESFLR